MVAFLLELHFLYLFFLGNGEISKLLFPKSDVSSFQKLVVAA